MTWSVAEIVSKLSEQYRLEPGDLIMTGTSEGVGALRPGDRVEATCAGLPPLSLSIAEPRP
jgi:fumarylpyruvate hydrolase